MTTIRIEPVPGTTLAEDKDAARQIREEKILPALGRDERVILDFAHVEIATQSYIHALVSDPIHRYGDRALELIEFRSCTDELRQLILTVVEYTLMAVETAEANGDRPRAAPLDV